MAADPKLTSVEKAKVAYLTGRMCKRSIAGEQVDLSDLQCKVDHILDRARERAVRGNSSK
ncbi:DUF6257 family protein [Streptomyces sp. WMMC897]|uniref:DUF6257 family protein n=1 Tax=Streptomyces sp. WMMC897 TaxID=3014782 RepID=UPI0022B62280|nr:DUF6257 family protein [Streptomyces sp. WMMC897]MCZ7417682.1 DUF6257 family protein [Streptomyces sp. WMMC897]